MFWVFVVKFWILYLIFIRFRVFGAVVWYFDLFAHSVSDSGRCYCVVSFYGLWREPVENLILGDFVPLFELPALFAEVLGVN